MNITSKSRYGLKIMIDLAEHDEELTQRADIASRQGIPLDYMDHVLGRLREAGLIASTRGRAGGYRLAKAAPEVSVLEIFMAVEDAFEPVLCLEGGKRPQHACTASASCGSKDAWSEISHAIHKSLRGIILSDIVARKSAVRVPGVDPLPERTSLVQECRAPVRRSGTAEKAL